MERTPTLRKSFVIVIWLVSQTEALPRWRGALETSSGERFYFDTLTGLNRLMREVGGWQEAPAQTSLEDEK
ncbi:MAG TPA: hypothetical protein VNK49_06165 [Anaerolineales bacterium]|nr:hypothetical protein [Anaerolineales bacterium]